MGETLNKKQETKGNNQTNRYKTIEIDTQFGFSILVSFCYTIFDLHGWTKKAADEPMSR